MADVRQVCRICYVTSSHKPNPTLTPESKIVVDGSLQSQKKCTVCRMEWAPIRVARETSGVPAGGRWVRIRPRPKISPNTEFQMCKNVQGGRGDCPRGLDCSYAHWKVELGLWNSEREREPRPAPPITGPYQYQMCKHIQSLGTCPYGQRCTFAHSEEELREWLRSMPPGSPAASPAGPGPVGALAVVGSGAFPPGGGGVYSCDICNLTCTSRKQLDDHFSGSKHRIQQLQMQGAHPQGPNMQGPQPPNSGVQGTRPPVVQGLPPSAPSQPDLRGVRRKPLLSFQITGFKMCMHVQASRRCIYGEYCTFAHSNEELQVWNRQLGVPAAPFPSHHQQGPPQNIVRYQTAAPPPHGGWPVHTLCIHVLARPPTLTSPAGKMVGGGAGGVVPVPSVMDHQKPNIFAASSGLDDFEEGSPAGAAEAHDFAVDVRRKITEEYGRRQEIGGFEVRHSFLCEVPLCCVCVSSQCGSRELLSLLRNPTTM